MNILKRLAERFLRWSERYTKTDMVALVQSGWWLNLGTVVLSLCALLLYIVFANVLTKEQYGVYQYLLSAGAIIGAFTLTGMNSAVARAVAQGYQGTLKRAVRTQLLFGIVPFLLGLGVALYYLMQGNMVLAAGFAIIGVFTPFLNSFNTYGSFFHGIQDYRGGFWYGLAWHLPFYGALIIAAFFSGLALVLLLVNLLVQSVATALIYRNVLRTKVTNDLTDPGAIPYGTHLSIMNLPGVIASQLDAILAFHYLGAAPLAIYAFATAIPERLTGFFKFLPTAALPRLSGKTPAEIRIALGGQRMWWIVLAVVLGVLAYGTVAPILFALLFPAYIDAVVFSQFYALVFISVIGNMFIVGLTAERGTKALYIFNVVSPVFQIGLQFVGVVFYGLWGLIIGRVLATFVSLFLAAVLLFLVPAHTD
ncbi:MAG: oligosaccharide flippase family protein [Candidatus Pacebacteria bacterium]|nr:oligosaccharide flippase family protein [Candidatus Paceibacterota bacterium]